VLLLNLFHAGMNFPEQLQQNKPFRRCERFQHLLHQHVQQIGKSLHQACGFVRHGDDIASTVTRIKLPLNILLLLQAVQQTSEGAETDVLHVSGNLLDDLRAVLHKDEKHTELMMAQIAADLEML